MESAPGEVIRITAGLEITPVLPTPTALALTLATRAAVQILEADTLLFEPGGSATTGERGPELDYESFAATVLGVCVPQAGVATGGPVTIPDPVAPASRRQTSSDAAARTAPSPR